MNDAGRFPGLTARLQTDTRVMQAKPAGTGGAG